MIEISDVDKMKLERKCDVVIIDDCEYIILIGDYKAQSITHKGNCKFCLQRNQPPVQESFDEHMRRWQHQ